MQSRDAPFAEFQDAGEDVRAAEGAWDFLRPAVSVGLAIACVLASRLPWGRGASMAAGPSLAANGFGHVASVSHSGPGSVSTAVVAENGRKVSLGTRIQYQIQKIMLMRLGGKVFAVMLVSLPVVFFGGIAYRLTTGNPWSLSFFRAYLLTGCVPGCDTIESTHPATFVTNIIFLLGLLTFAVLLGVVCEDISNVVNNIRSGNTDVVEEGHTVVLNYNKQLPAVLRQMSMAKQERRHGTFVKPVVILANMKKGELDTIVSRTLNGHHLDVYTRQGIVHSPADLKRVAADQAETIVLLQPDNEDSVTTAAKRAATIASLKAMGTGVSRTTQLVVQSPEKENVMEGLTNVNMAATTPPLPKESKLKVVEMHAAQTLDRMLAQCALQPGLGAVYSEILEQGEGMEFYVASCPSLAGQPYHVVRRHFDAAAVCGYLTDDKLTLNPSENDVYEEGSDIILLAPSYNKIKPRPKPLPPGPAWIKNVQRTYHENVSKNIVILNWCTHCTGVLESLAEFAPKGTAVTIVSSEPQELAVGKYKGLRVHQVEGNPASFQALNDAGVDKADSVIVTGLNALEANTADAQMLSTLLQIEDISTKKEGSRPIHVVASVNHPRTKSVAHHIASESRKTGSSCTVDLLLPDEISSGVLTQVAAQPRLLHVVRDLMNRSEIELYVRCPSDYELLGKGSLEWYDVAEVVRANGETPVGFIDRNGRNHIAPHAAAKHAFEEGDQVVVLAKDYVPSCPA